VYFSSLVTPLQGNVTHTQVEPGKAKYSVSRADYLRQRQNR